MRSVDRAQVTAIDETIGRRIKKILLARHADKSAIAARLGMAVEQFEDCLEGRCRFGATHLFLLSTALNVKVSAFFNDD